jgi:uncharacterized membrane protein
MNRNEYIARIAGLLKFLGNDERTEVLSDIEELYDGLAGREMNDGDIQTQIGSPGEVAAEYRLAGYLDRVDQAPGAASGVRIGFASLSGHLVRGAAFQLLGLVWLALALSAFGMLVTGAAGAVLAVTALAGFEPVTTTLAVPGIPPVSGAFIGFSIAAASISLLLALRLMMRALSGLMRNRLQRMPRTDKRAGGGAGERPDIRRLDSRRAVGYSLAAAAALAGIALLLMVFVPAPEFPLSIDRVEYSELLPGAIIEVRAHGVDVRLTGGDEFSARLYAELKRTFAQSIDFSVIPAASMVVIDADYREGLSWGINPRPVMMLTLPREPAAAAVSVKVILTGGAEIVLNELDEELRGSLQVERP